MSTAAVASSNTRMLLGVSNALASDTSWRCPWLRLDPEVTQVSRGLQDCNHAVARHCCLPPSLTAASKPFGKVEMYSLSRA